MSTASVKAKPGAIRPGPYLGKARCIDVPPGQYLLGDPCLSEYTDAQWDAWGKASNWFQDTPLAIDPESGAWVVAFGTRCGDGIFVDNVGNEYTVDSGTIGLVPFTGAIERGDVPDGMALITITRDDNTCARLDVGLRGAWLMFGTVAIYTGDPLLGGAA